MESWGPVPEDERTVLADGAFSGSPWVLEAWRQPDRDGVERTFYAVRGTRPEGMSFSRVDLGPDAAFRAHFEQREGGAGCVLFGPIAAGVAAVTVEPLEPERAAAQAATLVGGEGAIGRFFVHAFDRTIETAHVSAEPAGRWKYSTSPATNLRARGRRQVDEGVVIGTGRAPAGRYWRLSIWVRGPADIRLGFHEVDDPARFEISDRMGFAGSGGGGSPPAPDKLIRLSFMGGRAGADQHVIGTVAPSVDGARVQFENGREADAEIIRTDVVNHDYFVAYGPGNEEVVAVTALDENGHELAREERSADSVRASREFKQRRRD